MNLVTILDDVSIINLLKEYCILNRVITFIEIRVTHWVVCISFLDRNEYSNEEHKRIFVADFWVIVISLLWITLFLFFSFYYLCCFVMNKQRNNLKIVRDTPIRSKEWERGAIKIQLYYLIERYRYRIEWWDEWIWSGFDPMIVHYGY